MSDEKQRDEDEELVSEFKELFPEEGDEDEARSAGQGEAVDPIDELDAFLDDFERGIEPADEADKGQSAPAVELAPPADTPPAPDAASDAEAPEANHAAAPDSAQAEPLESLQDEQLSAGKRGAAQPELPVGEGETGRDPLEEIAAIAAANKAAAAPQGDTGSGFVASRRVVWSVVALMLVSLSLSATALWLAIPAGSGQSNTRGAVANLSGRGAATLDRDAAAMEAMRTELRTLAARVNELAVVIEGPMSHLRQSNEAALAEIRQRLARLEKAAPAGSAPVSAAAPAAKKASAASASSGGWAINLISLTSEKDADAELKRLQKLGIRAEKRRALKAGTVWYRLRVTGFASYEGAKAYIRTVEQKAGVKNAWVARD